MPAPPMPPPTGSGAAADAEWDRSFKQCLELLKGPGDERRFVGLLLVTKLLPQGSDAAVRAVLDALGWQFLQRLLLPLRRPTQAPPAAADAEALQHQAMCCGLGLAILAAACRLPDVAGGLQVLELLPLLLQVVRQGGVWPSVSAAMQPPSAAPGATGGGGAASAPSSTAPGPGDAEAVVDALECLVSALAAPGPAPPGADEGGWAGGARAVWEVAERAGALEAVAACLAALAPQLVVGQAPHAAQQGQRPGGAGPGAAGSPPPVERAALLAAAALDSLLQGGRGAAGGAHGSAAEMLGRAPGAVAQAVGALAALVGNQRLVQQGGAAGGGGGGPKPAGGAGPGEAGSAGAGSSSSDGGATGGAGGSSSGAGAGSGSAAQLQLEALHVMLLLLRRSQEPGAAPAAAELSRQARRPTGQPGARGGGAAAEAWPVALRRGLGWVLRSRAPAVLKHLALQVTALTVQLAGECWLLGGEQAGQPAAQQARPSKGQQGAAGGAGGGAEQPGSFLVLLVENLKIETGLLLHDALHPERLVPAEDARTSARGQRAAPEPSQRLLDELAAKAEQQRAAEERAVQAALAAGAGLQGDGGAAEGGAQPLLQEVREGEEGEAEMDVEAEAPAASHSSGAGPGPSSSNGGVAQDGPDVAAAAVGTTHGSAERAAGGAAHAAPPPQLVSAGSRAADSLPSCFVLFEAVVGALAADVAAADGEGVMEVDEGGAGMDVGGGAGGAGGSGWRQPVLTDSVLQTLMNGLDYSCDMMLQYLEAVVELQQPQGQEAQQQGQEAEGQQGQHGSAGAQPPASGADAAVLSVIGLGAARVLGRYFAEAPGAVRSERVLRSLPLAMSVGLGVQGGLQLGGGAQQQGGAGEQVGQEEEELALEELGLTFLLPGLLQATGPGADSRPSTLKALRDSPIALASCAAYLARTARTAAGAAARLARLLPGSAPPAGPEAGSALRPAGREAPSAAAAAAVAALAEEAKRAERAAADCAMLLLNVMEPAALAALAGKGAQAGAAGDAAAQPPTLGPAWEVVCRWGAAGAAAAAPAGAPTREQAAAAASAAGAVLPPALAQLLPAAWAVHLWAESRASTLQALRGVDPLAPPPQRPGAAASVLRLLADARLTPRALLCCACLAAVVASTALRRIAERHAALERQHQAPGAAGAPSAGPPAAAADLASAQALAALLPPAVTDGVCALALAAAAAGTALEVAQLSPAAGEAGAPAVGAPAPAGAAGGGDGGVQAVVDDYAGDGEVCWGRLLGSCVQLLEMWPPMRAHALGCGWVRAVGPVAQAVQAGRGVGVGEAAQEVLQDVNLLLLLRVLGGGA